MKNTMKKTWLVLLLAGVFLFAACSDDDPEPTEEPEETTEAAVETEAPEETPEPEPEPTEQIDTGDLSDDLYSFQVMLDGTIYTLPTAFSEFAADGWTVEDGDETLNPDYYTSSTRISKGDDQISVQFINVTSDVQTLENCHVGQVILDDYYYGDSFQAALPGGITVGSTYDEVIAAYGQPSDENVTDSLIFLYYKSQSYQKLDVTLDKETEVVTKLTYQNLYATEDDEAGGASTYDGEVPDIVTNYQAPDALGDTWDSFTLSYDGVVYSLPAPVAYFLENGWVLVGDDTEVPAQRTSSSFKMRYENSTITVYVTNYTDTAQPISNCFVTQIRHQATDASVDIILPGNIGPGSTMDEVRAALGEPDDISESSSTSTYTYKNSVNERIEISFWSSYDMCVSSVVINNAAGSPE